MTTRGTYYASKALLSESLITKLDHYSVQYGRSYDSYIVNDPIYEYFWSHDESGVVGFMTHSKAANIVGGLLCPKNEKQNLLDEFLEFARARKLTVSFYNIDNEDLPYFRQRGFEVTKWGEDGTIPLNGHTWAGGQYEWVRRQANFCKRQGIDVREVIRSDVSAESWQKHMDEAISLSDALLATKPQREEMKALEGHLNGGHLGQRRYFEARSAGGSGALVGFVLCNPLKGGREWSFEMYRHHPDAVKGVVPFLFHEVVLHLSREGYDRVSLCLLPGQNVAKPMAGDNPWTRRSLVLWNKWGRSIFDTAGLNHFKSRFRPEYIPLHVCVYPRTTLASVWSFIQVWGVADLKRFYLVNKIRKWAWNKAATFMNPVTSITGAIRMIPTFRKPLPALGKVNSTFNERIRS